MALLTLSTLVTAQTIIHSFNMSLTFRESGLKWGAYANGDYWIVGPATLIETHPPAVGGRNGVQINPSDVHSQALDDRMFHYNTSQLATLPASLVPGDSITKTISMSDTSSRPTPCIAEASVVTLVSAPQRRDAFRPAYFGSREQRLAAPAYTVSDLRVSLLANLSATSDAPTDE